MPDSRTLFLIALGIALGHWVVPMLRARIGV